MGKLHLALLIPASIQLASLIIVLLILISPAPFNHSSISLLRIEPYSKNSTSSTASNASDAANASVYSMSLNTSNATSAPLPLSSTNFPTSQPSMSPAASTPASASSANNQAPTPAPNQSPNARPTDSVSDAVQESNGKAQSSVPQDLGKREDAAKRPLGILNATDTYVQPSSLSKVRLSFGPLGSCSTDADGKRRCSRPLLLPSFNTSAIPPDQIGEYDMQALPSSIKAVPIILLVVLVILIISFALSLPPLLSAYCPSKFGFLIEAGPRERAMRQAQRYMLWAMYGTWILLAASGISLRVTFSSAKTAFNASNADRALPLESTKDSAYPNVGLQAELGSAFALTWATLGMLLVYVLLERRPMRRAEAVAQARADVEAQWGRNVLQAGQTLVKNASGTGTAASPAPPAGNDGPDQMVMRSVPPASASTSNASLELARQYWITSPAANVQRAGTQHHYVHAYGQHPTTMLHTQEREYLCDSPFQIRRAASPPPFEGYVHASREREWERRRRGASSPTPTESAYEHHMRSVEDLDLSSSELGSQRQGYGRKEGAKGHQTDMSGSSHASFANSRADRHDPNSHHHHQHQQQQQQHHQRKDSFGSSTLSRGPSPAPSYWSNAQQSGLHAPHNATQSAEMEKAREEAKEARARVEMLERELRERERKNEEWKEEMRRIERIEMVKRRQRGGLGYHTS